MPGKARSCVRRDGPRGRRSARDHTASASRKGAWDHWFAQLGVTPGPPRSMWFEQFATAAQACIADGSLEGLMLVSTRTMQLNRQFF